MARSPDGTTLAGGRTLAAGDGEGTIQLWDVALPTLDAAASAICQAVGRDLDAAERRRYLGSDVRSEPACVR
ncbi:hypothetical protein [Paractinoplanes globisporus]|uniref:Uncharacterized protein n=1 Tax=Paractinoplanes globisporus TaxID=113565 RepID=A0ABW6WW08_9ACTN|nr:hypothetical protein [Actinoplanes globisporus]